MEIGPPPRHFPRSWPPHHPFAWLIEGKVLRREDPVYLKEKLVLIGLHYNIFKRLAHIAITGWCNEMNANLSMEKALDELERRLDSLEEKVSIAMEQSTALLDYVRNHNIQAETARTITRRIILEETTMLPEPVTEET